MSKFAQKKVSTTGLSEESEFISSVEEEPHSPETAQIVSMQGFGD